MASPLFSGYHPALELILSNRTIVVNGVPGSPAPSNPRKAFITQPHQ